MAVPAARRRHRLPHRSEWQISAQLDESADRYRDLAASGTWPTPTTSGSWPPLLLPASRWTPRSRRSSGSSPASTPTTAPTSSPCGWSRPGTVAVCGSSAAGRVGAAISDGLFTGDGITPNLRGTAGPVATDITIERTVDFDLLPDSITGWPATSADPPHHPGRPHRPEGTDGIPAGRRKQMRRRLMESFGAKRATAENWHRRTRACPDGGGRPRDRPGRPRVDR